MGNVAASKATVKGKSATLPAFTNVVSLNFTTVGWPAKSQTFS
jgi:hypothetical protein